MASALKGQMAALIKMPLRPSTTATWPSWPARAAATLRRSRRDILTQPHSLSLKAVVFIYVISFSPHLFQSFIIRQISVTYQQPFYLSFSVGQNLSLLISSSSS